MVIYDGLAEQTKEVLKGLDSVFYEYRKDASWCETKELELVMQKDCALEIGTAGRTAVNYTCITTNEKLVDAEGTMLYGADLAQGGGADGYARITFVLVDENSEIEEDSDKMYKLIQDIDFVKYHVFPKGFMMRSSGKSAGEQIRVSKNAIREGMSFENIGNTLINHYKENTGVKKVKVVFVTDGSADFKTLSGLAEKAVDIRRSMSMIMKGMPTDCGVCEIRQVCAEVEGLKKIHFGKNK